jgi:hypothetical protein
MPEYLAERYEPGATRAQVEVDASRLAAAARKLEAEGHLIEFLGSTFVPGDEACLSRFASSSAELVEAAHRLASVPVERVVETQALQWQADNEGTSGHSSGRGYGNVAR